MHVNARAMLQLFPQRRLWLAFRINSRSLQVWRQVSTSSAINRGLKATRDDREPKGGGRDRSKRSFAEPRGASNTPSSRYDFTERTASGPRRRTLGLERSRQDRPNTRGSDRQRRRSVGVGSHDDSRSNKPVSTVRTHNASSDGQDRPRGGLLREIKSACKLVQQIQQRETADEGVDGMIKELRVFLDSINSFVESGSFKEEPSEAVASILQKHAAEGTFARGERRSSARSMICQRPDGKLVVTVGRGGPVQEESERSGSRKASHELRPERPERRPPVERSSGGRREMSADRDADDDDEIPVPLPYTTAASEFLYGYNTVLAALRSKRRKLYRLYVHPKIFDREAGGEGGRGGRRDSGGKAANDFVTLAKAAGVPFRNEFKTKLLDRMSDGRPHNGVLLEASKLPAPPVMSLGKPDYRSSTIPLQLARQSVEEAEVNGAPETINSVANTWRHPLIVLLDGITDPGNLGNILRTCHFYGVDAVAVATNTCANLSSAVLAKASSGACEAVRLLSLPQPSNFAYESARNGWKIYASVAPTPDAYSQKEHLTISKVATASPLAKHPCILMLGAEGEGLRENLRNRAHNTVSIERGKKIKGTPNVGVDSINVSVAAGVLMDAFLRKPIDAPDKKDTAGELGW